MNPGKLNKRITFYEMDKSQKNEANEIMPVPKLLLVTWGKIETKPGTISIVDDKSYEVVSYEITIRFRSNVDESLIIKLPSGHFMGIDAVVNENEENKFLIITGKKDI